MHLKNRKILLFHDQIFEGYYRVCRMNRRYTRKKRIIRLYSLLGSQQRMQMQVISVPVFHLFFEDWDIEQNHY